MVAIALLCAIIYYTILLVQVVVVTVTLCRKQENIEALSDSAKKRYAVSGVCRGWISVNASHRISSSHSSVS